MDASRAAVARLVDPTCNSLGLGPSFGRIDLRRARRRGSARLDDEKRRRTRIEESGGELVRRPGPPIRLFPLTAAAVTVGPLLLAFAADLPVTRSAMRQLFYAPQCTVFYRRRRRRRHWHVSTVRSRTFYIRSPSFSLSLVPDTLDVIYAPTFAKFIFLEVFMEETRVQSLTAIEL